MQLPNESEGILLKQWLLFPQMVSTQTTPPDRPPVLCVFVYLFTFKEVKHRTLIGSLPDIEQMMRTSNWQSNLAKDANSCLNVCLSEYKQEHLGRRCQQKVSLTFNELFNIVTRDAGIVCRKVNVSNLHARWANCHLCTNHSQFTSAFLPPSSSLWPLTESDAKAMSPATTCGFLFHILPLTFCIFPKPFPNTENSTPPDMVNTEVHLKVKKKKKRKKGGSTTDIWVMTLSFTYFCFLFLSSARRTGPEWSKERA